jgi:hypothetical protein
VAFTQTRRVDIGSFIKARIRIRIRSQTSGSESGCGSDQKGPDPNGSGFAKLHKRDILMEKIIDKICFFAKTYLSVGRENRKSPPPPFLPTGDNVEVVIIDL